jgi:hypothetical protein
VVDGTATALDRQGNPRAGDTNRDNASGLRYLVADQERNVGHAIPVAVDRERARAVDVACELVASKPDASRVFCVL